MPRTDNPFFMLTGNPYDANPFRLLGLGVDAAPAEIERRARTCARALTEGYTLPVGSEARVPADADDAAAALRDPVVRVLFAIFHDYLSKSSGGQP